MRGNYELCIYLFECFLICLINFYPLYYRSLHLSHCTDVHIHTKQQLNLY